MRTSIIFRHLKGIAGFFVAVLAFIECFTTGVVTSAITLFGIQSSVVNTMVVAPTNLLNFITMNAPPYVIDAASKIFITCMGPIMAAIDFLLKIGGMFIDQFGMIIGWVFDMVVRIVMLVMDKVAMCIDLFFRIVNTAYQMVYQFFSQSISAIIDRVMYFWVKKPWGSFCDTPLGMQYEQKVEYYLGGKWQKLRNKFDNHSKENEKTA